jgi:HSP20 family protein
MRDKDSDDPFDEFFEEIERMMNDMMDANTPSKVDRSGQQREEKPGRSVHVDVHEADDELRVVADLPGVTKDAIDLKCDGTTLYVEAGSEARQYRERIELPTRVDEHSASATYNNGILEVSFDRLDNSTTIDL